MMKTPETIRRDSNRIAAIGLLMQGVPVAWSIPTPGSRDGHVTRGVITDLYKFNHLPAETWFEMPASQADVWIEAPQVPVAILTPGEAAGAFLRSALAI